MLVNVYVDAVGRRMSAVVRRLTRSQRVRAQELLAVQARLNPLCDRIPHADQPDTLHSIKPSDICT
jgi:hypothetical protein